jgi:hypothetical protein
MRPTVSSLLIALSLALATTSVGAQESGPPVTGAPAAGAPAPAPPPRTQSEMYVPLYGVTAGISIPAGRIGEDHGAGYALGGLIEYAVTGQPYSLRGEGLYQRFPVNEGRAEEVDVNMFSLGTTVVYRLQQSAGQTFLTGGIAVYKATREGTRPGFNFGTGLTIPLTGFSALAEIRLHVMLADSRPVLALPLTVGIRF